MAEQCVAFSTAARLFPACLNLHRFCFLTNKEVNPKLEDDCSVTDSVNETTKRASGVCERCKNERKSRGARICVNEFSFKRVFKGEFWYFSTEAPFPEL